MAASPGGEQMVVPGGRVAIQVDLAE